MTERHRNMTAKLVPGAVAVIVAVLLIPVGYWIRPSMGAEAIVDVLDRSGDELPEFRGIRNPPEGIEHPEPEVAGHRSEFVSRSGDLGAVETEDRSKVSLMPEGGDAYVQLDLPAESTAGSPNKHPVIVNSIGMSLKLVPAGRFQMGSISGDSDERPVHEVTLTSPFYLGIYEVTQQQYERVTGTNPSSFNGRAKNPVENVSWEAAVEFCSRLSAIPAEKSFGRVYRLPSEAEWEYACRAGTTTAFSFDDDPGQLADYAWFKGNSDRSTQSVGKKQPNAWGLYDMHGNVWEWCQDWKSDYSSGSVTNPVGPPSGSTHVYRGGSWRSKIRSCRSSDRFKHIRPPGYRDNRVGFRVVLETPL